MPWRQIFTLDGSYRSYGFPGTKWSHLIKTIKMSNHNICFHVGMRKLSMLFDWKEHICRAMNSFVSSRASYIVRRLYGDQLHFCLQNKKLTKVLMLSKCVIGVTNQLDSLGECTELSVLYLLYVFGQMGLNKKSRSRSLQSMASDQGLCSLPLIQRFLDT